MRIRPWNGEEQFGADIIFNVGDSAAKLEGLRKSLIDLNSAMEMFAQLAADFNAAVQKVADTSKLVKTVEALLSKMSKLGPAISEGNKKGIEAESIRKKLIKTILQENQAYNKQNKLVRSQAVGLDDLNRKITVNANAQGKLLGVKIKDTIQTQAQINAEKKLSAQYERARVQFAALSGLRNRGLLKNLEITPRINTATGKLVETWKGLDAQGKAFNATITRVNGRVISVAGNLPTLNRAMQKTGKSLHEFTLSWKSMLRIIAAQAIRRVLFTFISQLKEAVDKAVEFSIKIAEIRTISQQNQLATEEWASGLRKLSDSFGIDLLNQTEAAYQTLSNQVAHGAEVFGFLEQANKLAIATVSDSASAVQFLSAVQNAYNLTTKDTADISAKAFKIVELGRIRLNEIATSIGQVAVPAKALGISFSELGAALAVITNRGVAVDEAQTLLRSVMLSLIKPTKEMKGLLRDMGFVSSEAALKALGFAGVLGEIEKRTKNSLTEIGKFTRRIRGTVGVAVFAGKGLQDYKNDVIALENAQKSFGEATKIIFESAGKNIQKEVNKIRNYFTNDLAIGFTEALAFINRKIISLTTAVKTFASVIKIALAPAIILAGSVTLAWVVALGPLTLALATVAAIGGVVKTAIDKYTESLNKAAEASEKNRKQQVKDAEIVNKAIVDKTFKAYTKMQQIVFKTVASIRRKNFQLVDQQLALDKNIGKGIASAYSDVTKALDAGLKDIKDSIKEANSIIENAASKIIDLRKELDRKLFEAVLGKIEDPSKQIAAIKARIQKLTIKTTISTGLDKKAIAEAEDAFKEISNLYTLIKQKQEEIKNSAKEEVTVRNKLKKVEEDIAKVKRKAVSDEAKALIKIRSASSRGGPVGITTSKGKVTIDTANERAKAADLVRSRKQADNELNLNRLNAKRLDLVNQLTAIQKKNASVGKEQVNVQEKQLDLLRQQIKFQKDLETQAKAAKVLEEAKFKQQQATIQDIKDSYVDVLNITAKGLLQEKDLVKQKKGIEDALKSIDTFQTKLNNKRNILDTSARLRLEEKLSDRRLQLQKLLLANDTEQSLKNAEEQTKVRLAVIAKEKKASKEQLDNTSKRIIGLKNSITESVKFVLTHTLGSQPEADKTLKVLKDTLDKSTVPNIIKLEGLLKKVIDAPGKQLATLPSTKLIVGALTTLAKLQKQRDNQIAEQQKTAIEANKKLEDLKKLQSKLAPETLLKEQLTEAKTQTKTLSQILIALQTPNQRTTTKAFGGQVGTDSIPAMLSPGEFVMNARSTRKFYSQLVAMNATPMARGGIAGTSVGDINVNMQSSGNENYDVTKFGKALRRQIRRGTLKLN